MENTHPVSGKKSAAAPEKPARRFGWKLALKGLLLVCLLLFGIALGAGTFVYGKFYGTSNPIKIWISATGQFVAMDRPEKFFPGRTRLNILCLGLDRNIVVSKDPKINGMPSTKDARSDVMMIASVDLINKTVSVLSVPRDTRVKLPRLERWAKINEAHSRGGVSYTIDTVSQFLGISIDNYVVIKQEAIMEAVNALGGLKLKVARDMDYDDNWGQLHVHLKEGEYTLDGQQVVGFMRFRHDAEGDFGRIKRQQQVIQKLSEQVTSPQVMLKALGLIDVLQKYVRTDLSKDQQIALAHLMHKVGQANIQTLSLPVADTATIDGISYVIADEDKKEAAVDWIINGNPDAMNRLITVQVKNQSGDPGLYQKTYDCLRHYGFHVIHGGRARGETLTAPRVVQRTNIRGAGKRVLEVLGVTGNVEKSEEDGADVTIYVGTELQASSVLQTPELWPEVPERKITAIPRSDRPRRRRRSRRQREEPVAVQVRESEPEPAPAEPSTEVEPELSIPGTAEPEPSSGPATSPAPPAAPAVPAEPKRPSTETPGTE